MGFRLFVSTVTTLRCVVEHTLTRRISLRPFSMALLLNDRMKLIRTAVQSSVNGHAAIDQGNHEG